jgi:hypothetical protein
VHPKATDLNLVLWNVHGVSGKSAVLEELCQDNVHLLLLTETWTPQGLTPPFLTGYQHISQSREYLITGRAWGGLAVYIRDDLFPHICACKARPSSNTLWVKLRASAGFERDVYLGLCYFPPHQSSHYSHTTSQSDPFENLKEDVDHYSREGHVILAGDFNARTGMLSDCLDDCSDLDRFLGSAASHPPIPERRNLDNSVNVFGRKLTSLCKESGLLICNGRLPGDESGAYTFQSANTGSQGVGGQSLIDYFITDTDVFFGAVTHLRVLPPPFIRDHLPIRLTLTRTQADGNGGSSCKATLLGQLLIHESGFSKYREALQDPTATALVSETRLASLTPEAAAAAVHQHIVQAAAQAFKERAREGGSCTFPINRWFDAECKQTRKRFQELLKRKADGHLVALAEKQYHTLIRRKKRQYEARKADVLLKLAKCEPRKFWKCFKRKPRVLTVTDKEAWETHFKHLLAKPVNQDVTPPTPTPGSVALSENPMEGVKKDLLSMNSHELNVDITLDEVESAIGKMKGNKGCGIDDMKAELIIAGKEVLLQPLTALFNSVFHGTYPEAWSTGVITPIFKSGDAGDCGNYRGVTVGTALSKLYAMVLNDRLSAWCEKYHCRADGQAGFRKDFRCTDQQFILRTLIERAKFRSRRLYCCFVDFSKAFDTIPRDKLWERLKEIGLHGNMLDAVRSLYDRVQACVNTPSGQSDHFDSEMGVKQGCPLSPLLFGIYLDKLEVLLEHEQCDAPELQARRVPALLFADDSILCSESPIGLQVALNSMKFFCDSYGLKVNIGKTKVVVFRGSSAGCSWRYGDREIEQVGDYKYLGLKFAARKKLSSSCQEGLLVAAKKSVHGLFSRCAALNLSFPVLQCQLFDLLVRPILLYGTEVWAVDMGLQVPEHVNVAPQSLVEHEQPPPAVDPTEEDRQRVDGGMEEDEGRREDGPGLATLELPDVEVSSGGDGMAERSFGSGTGGDGHENLHRYFLKRVLGVKSSTPTDIVLGEFGRFPLDVFRWKLIARYWNRLVDMKNSRLLKLAFLESNELTLIRSHNDRRKDDSWVGLVRNKTQALGYNLEGFDKIDIKVFMEKLQDNFKSAWWQRLTRSPGSKGHTYSSIKSPEFKREDYLQEIRLTSARDALARFRTGSHWLEIERGRYVGKPRELRTCQNCIGVMEDEEHMVFHCSTLQPLRLEFCDLFQGSLNLGDFLAQDSKRVAAFILGCKLIKDGQTDELDEDA